MAIYRQLRDFGSKRNLRSYTGMAIDVIFQRFVLHRRSRYCGKTTMSFLANEAYNHLVVFRRNTGSMEATELGSCYLTIAGFFERPSITGSHFPVLQVIVALLKPPKSLFSVVIVDHLEPCFFYLIHISSMSEYDILIDGRPSGLRNCFEIIGISV